MHIREKLLDFLGRLIERCENKSWCAECKDRQTCYVMNEVLEQIINEADGEDLINFYLEAIKSFEFVYQEEYKGE